MSRASSLFRIQELDLQLDRIAARLDEITRLLADAQAVLAARRGEAEARENSAGFQTTVRSAEGEVERQKEKLQQTDQKLYGGTISNPKELQDLQAESEALTRHLATLEDRLLEAMVELEEAEKGYQSAADELERAEIEQAYRSKHLVEEQAALFREQQRLQEQRQAAVQLVHPGDLAMYDKLRRSIGGLAVAGAQDGSCSACGLTLSASLKQATRSSDEPVRCPQCGRILYGG
jgi:uncharacterized protein